MEKPFLRGWLYVPHAWVSSLAMIKNQLTVHSKYRKDMNGEPTKPIQAFDDATYPGWIGLPLRFGMSMLKLRYPDNAWKSQYIDQTSYGSFRIDTPTQPDLNHEHAHPDQKFIVPEVLSLLRRERATMIDAPTGSGKTVMALSIAAQTRLKTIIFVDQERLKEQWILEIIDKLGYARADIGIIQGPRCDLDKDITICMVRTVYSGKFADKMVNQFGLAIIDEIHVLGAPGLAKLLGRMNPWAWLGMSATLGRKDGRDQVYKFFFGHGEVKAEAPALPLKVVVLPYKANNWGTNINSKILCISRDSKFAERVAKQIVKLYKDERQILVICDHKSHIQAIFKKAVDFGLPAFVAGHFYIGGASEQVAANHGGVVLNQKQYFDWIIDQAQVVFATKGMMAKGVSIARLDCGMDCIPRAEDTQLRGRIRRPLTNKRLPVWYTFNHVNDRMLNNWCESRVKSYVADESIELVRHDVL